MTDASNPVSPNLTFTTPLAETSNIVFGLEEGNTVVYYYDAVAEIASAVGTIRATALLTAQHYDCQVQVVEPITVEVEATYLVNNPRFSEARAVSNFQQACPLTTLNSQKPQEARVVGFITSSLYQEAKHLVTLQSLPFADARPLQISRGDTSLEATKLGQVYKHTWQTAALVEKTSTLEFENTIPLGRHLTLPHQEAVKIHRKTKDNFAKAVKVGWSSGQEFGSATKINRSFSIRADMAQGVPNSVEIIPVRPNPSTNLKTPNITFRCLPNPKTIGRYKHSITFNDTCVLQTRRPNITDYSEPYIVINTFDIFNADTGEVIQALSASFSSDISSYAWSGVLKIPENQVSKLMPVGLEATKVKLLFNGREALFQVGKISRTISFNQRAYTAEIISTTVVLDAPTASPLTYYLDEAKAPYLIVQELIKPDQSAVSLEWEFLDPLEWVVSAGAFSIQNVSPIKAVGALIDGSGAFLYSSLDKKSLHIKRKRPFAFWESVTDAIPLNENLITTLSYNREEYVRATGVYVISGNQATTGVTVQALRLGYDGSVQAPQVVSPTLTSLEVSREAAKYVLGKAGVVETRTVTSPLIVGEPLVLPSEVVSLRDNGETVISTNLSTSVVLEFNKQVQTLTLECIQGFL